LRIDKFVPIKQYLRNPYLNQLDPIETVCRQEPGVGCGLAACIRVDSGPMRYDEAIDVLSKKKD